MSDPVRVPLWAKGGVVCAYTLIDRADAEWVTESRWFLKRGYAGRNIVTPAGKQTVRLHRVILGLEFGDGMEADHINRDPLDNRRSNLRVVTHAQNLQNQRSVPGSSSRFRNVAWDGSSDKWQARIRVNGVVHRLGKYRNELDAAVAAQAGRDRLMPFAQPDLALVEALAALSMKDVAA